MQHLCIDIDNVLAKTDTLIRELIRKHTKGRVSLGYEDVIVFDYRQCLDSNGNKLTNEEWTQIHDEFSKEENILDLSPFSGVQAYLQMLINAGFELHFATSRLPQARIPTIKWLENHAFPNHRLHFVNHREKHIVLGTFFAVIEDDLEQAKEFARQETLAYVIAHPWNVTDNTEHLFRVKDWKDICEQLRKRLPL